MGNNLRLKISNPGKFYRIEVPFTDETLKELLRSYRLGRGAEVPPQTVPGPDLHVVSDRLTCSLSPTRGCVSSSPEVVGDPLVDTLAVSYGLPGRSRVSLGSSELSHPSRGSPQEAVCLFPFDGGCSLKGYLGRMKNKLKYQILSFMIRKQRIIKCEFSNFCTKTFLKIVGVPRKKLENIQ